MSRRIIISLLIAALLLVLAYPCFAAPRKDNLGRTIWTGDTLSLTVKATDELSGVKTVELWYRMNGGNWKKWQGEPKPGEKAGTFKYDFKAPQDGVFEFYSVSIDAVGNASATPGKESTPMAIIHFDLHAPDLMAIYTNKSNRIRPGDNISFRWSASDSSLRAVSLKYYFNGDNSKPAFLTLKGTNGLGRLRVPQKGVNSVTLCLVGEDYAGFTSETKPFSFIVEGDGTGTKEIDVPSPVQPRTQPGAKKDEPEKCDTTHTEPTRTETAGTDPYCVVLQYDVVQSGISGLEKVELWVARIDGDGGRKKWTLKDWSSKPKGRFVFKANESGRYAFYIVAGNKAGVWSKVRPDGVKEIKPDYTKWIDPYRPSLKISVPKSSAALRSDGAASAGGDNEKPEKAHSPAPLSAPRPTAPAKAHSPLDLMSGEIEKPVVRTAPVMLPDPTDASGHLKRGREFIRTGEIEKAITELARASDYFPNNAAVLNEYGIALYRKGLYSLAIANFQQAARLSPDETRYQWNLFLCYCDLGKCDSAAQSALDILAMDGMWAEGAKMIDSAMRLYRRSDRADEISGFLGRVLEIEGLGEGIREHIQAKIK